MEKKTVSSCLILETELITRIKEGMKTLGVNSRTGFIRLAVTKLLMELGH